MTQTELLEGQSGLPVENPTQAYWHTDPSKILLGHRTTSELPRSADVVIVGTGITGSFAAHFMKEKNPDLNIVMLEAREACWGATGRNGGHCQPLMYSPAPHIASFELRNYSYLKTLVEDYSIPCDWHSTTGVHAFYSADLFEAARRKVAKLTENYPDLAANVAVITKGEGGSPSWLLKEEQKELTLEGLRVGSAEGAVVQWNAASLWPYKLVAFILERLLARDDGGFNLQTKTPATSIAKKNKADGSTSWTVNTPRGSISAPKVLLATNGYTSHLIPSFTELLTPVRGQVSSLKPPPTPESSQSQPPLDIGHTFYFAGYPDDPFRRDDYLIQRPPPAAELVFGGGRLHAKGRGVGVWDDSTIDEPVAWYLRGELSDAMDLSVRPAVTDPSAAAKPPAAAGDDSRKPATAAAATATKKQDLEPTHEWTGIMGYSRDGHPWIGAVPPSLLQGVVVSSEGQTQQPQQPQRQEPGLWVCAGYTGHGMPNASLCAKAVVDMMYGGGGGGGGATDGADEGEVVVGAAAAAELQHEVKQVLTGVRRRATSLVSGGGGDDRGGDGGRPEGEEGDMATSEQDNNYYQEEEKKVGRRLADGDIDLPPEYLLTEARVRAARNLETVDQMDAKGSLFSEYGGDISV